MIKYKSIYNIYYIFAQNLKNKLSCFNQYVYVYNGSNDSVYVSPSTLSLALLTAGPTHNWVLSFMDYLRYTEILSLVIKKLNDSKLHVAL